LCVGDVTAYEEQILIRIWVCDRPGGHDTHCADRGPAPRRARPGDRLRDPARPGRADSPMMCQADGPMTCQARLGPSSPTGA
jgi:hypothetical protein